MYYLVIILAILVIFVYGGDFRFTECGVRNPSSVEACTSAKTNTGKTCCFVEGNIADKSWSLNTYYSYCKLFDDTDTFKSPYMTNEYEVGENNIKVSVKANCGAKTVTVNNNNPKVCNTTNIKPNNVDQCNSFSKGGVPCCLLQGTGKNLCVWGEPGSTTNYNFMGMKMSCSNKGKNVQIWNGEEYNSIVAKKGGCGGIVPKNRDECFAQNSGNTKCCYVKGNMGNIAGSPVVWSRCASLTVNEIILSSFYDSYGHSNPSINPPMTHTYEKFDCGNQTDIDNYLTASTLKCGTNNNPSSFNDCNTASSTNNACCILWGKKSNVCIWASAFPGTSGGLKPNVNFVGLRIQCSPSGDLAIVTSQEQLELAVDMQANLSKISILNYFLIILVISLLI